MKNTFVVISSAGPNRDLSKDTVSSRFGMNTRSLSIDSLLKVPF